MTLTPDERERNLLRVLFPDPRTCEWCQERPPTSVLRLSCEEYPVQEHVVCGGCVQVAREDEGKDGIKIEGVRPL